MWCTSSACRGRPATSERTDALGCAALRCGLGARSSLSTRASIAASRSLTPPTPERTRPPTTCQSSRPVDLIISADTVVEKDGRILEKPDDSAHAQLMLQG